MTPSEFKTILTALQQKQFRGHSTDKLLSYLRQYAIIYNLIDVNCLDSTYGSRALYREKLKHLFTLLLRRATQSTDLKERAILYNSLSTIVDSYIFTIDPTDLCTYRQGIADLIDTYLAAHHTHEPETPELYLVLALIILQWNGLVQDDTDDTPAALTLLHTYLRRWQTSDAAPWPHLPVNDALKRILLLDLNSSLMQDKSYDDLLHRAYAYHAVQRIDLLPEAIHRPLDPDELHTLMLLFCTIRHIILPDTPVMTYMHRIAQLIEAQMPHHDTRSLLWLQCQCVIMEDECWQISEEAQRALFEE